MMRRVLLMSGLAAFFVFNQGVFAQGQAVEPGADFKKAHESFIKKDFQASAAEIRKSADFLKKEAASASGKGKKMLEASARELDKLADSVEKGAVKSDRELKGAFSRAEHAVANNYYVKATDSWSRKEAKETGEALGSAAEHMEKAAYWSGHKLDAGASRAIKEGREVSGKLVEGTGYVPEEVGKGLKDMGDAISRFGRKVLPEKK